MLFRAIQIKWRGMHVKWYAHHEWESESESESKSRSVSPSISMWMGLIIHMCVRTSMYIEVYILRPESNTHG